jgi:hypothetical protein
MARNENSPSSEGAGHPVGRVAFAHGTVKAISAEGVERLLSPDSPVYANERIIADSNGSASIVFDDPRNTQLSIGRMKEVLLDDDVLDTGVDLSDVSSGMGEVQRALLARFGSPVSDMFGSDHGHASETGDYSHDLHDPLKGLLPDPEDHS